MSDVLYGQEHLLDVHKLVEDLWQTQGKDIKLMFHFWWPDQHNEVVMPVGDGEMTALIARKFCEERKPSAVMVIAEAWAFVPKDPKSIDFDRMMTDGKYYAEQKKNMIRKEMLMVSIETEYGVRSIHWEIIRSGDTAMLGPMEVSEHLGEGAGRLGALLPKKELVK